MEEAREVLKKFCEERNGERIFDDLAPLDSSPNLRPGD